MEEIQNRQDKTFSSMHIECETHKKKDSPFKNKLPFFILLAFIVCSLLHHRNTVVNNISGVGRSRMCNWYHIYMARGVTILLLF